MEYLYFFLGSVVLFLVLCDFLFTTLSGSGAGFITHRVTSLLYVFTRKLYVVTGRKTYDYTGLIVNLGALVVWVLLIWLSLFLIFSSHPGAITNSSGRIATAMERLYFTGYTLSTLGIGNFKPTTQLFETLTVIFSFFGFVLFTSSMTYFLSVFNAVVNKRRLARNIKSLGSTPQEIAGKIASLNESFALQQILSLQMMVEQHSVSHQAYPVVHFFSHSSPDFCISINMARLDEAIGILLSTPENKYLKEELQLLQSSLTHLLDHMNTYFSSSMPYVDSSPKEEIFPYNISAISTGELRSRRQRLSKMLKSEDFEWQDVLSANR